MNRIFKYVLSPEITLNLPFDAQILSVGNQDDQLMMWALVDSSLGATHEPRQIVVFATGQAVSHSASNLQFVGTVQMVDGLVFHVFELTKP